MKKLLTPLLISALLPTIGSANWDVQKSEKDVFGNVNVTASAFGDNGSLLRFECGSSTEPKLVYLIRDNSGEIPSLGAYFYHVDQNRERSSADATLISWNEHYIAVKVDEFHMLREVAEHMVVATRSIPIGVEVPAFDLRLSDTFSSRGSTAAGRTILEHCVAAEPASERDTESTDALEQDGTLSN